MIITKAPFRLPIGGGGTDLPFFYSKYGGQLITAGINKYNYIILEERPFYDEFYIRYSKMEVVKTVEEIQHTRIKAALQYLKIKNPIEITAISDVPAGTGLGSSSTFLVALLKALHIYKKEDISTKKLAEEAADIEINILKEPIGKQDQYASAFGGIMSLSISKKNDVLVSPLSISYDTIKDLENNLHMFYTGIIRSSSEVITDQTKNAVSDQSKMECMKEIKQIGIEIKSALECGNLKRFGEWMNIHWETKKKMSEKMSNPQIDDWYNIALKNGALGGKIMGAGGGGFFIFYCESNVSTFKNAMISKGLKYIHFKFDFDGCKVVFDAK